MVLNLVLITFMGGRILDYQLPFKIGLLKLMGLNQASIMKKEALVMYRVGIDLLQMLGLGTKTCMVSDQVLGISI